MADETADTRFTPPAAEPTATVGAGQATREHPLGTASPYVPVTDPGPAPETVEQRPEALVGAAFAGGLLLAMILKRLGR